MAKIQNTEIIENGVQDLKLSRIADKIPTETSDKIILTYSLNKIKNGILSANSRSTTTGAGVTFFTASTTKRTFMTGILIAVSADVTADNTTITITAQTADGATKTVGGMIKQTTTAYSDKLYLSFDEPIELLKGGLVRFINAFTVGASSSLYNLYGFELD